MNPIKITPDLRDEIARRLDHPEPVVEGKVILSVEDDDAAEYLIRLALREVAPEVDLRRVVDGDVALKFLRREDPFNHAPRPSLILMTLNLPKVSGPEVLAQLKADDGLKGIPVLCSRRLISMQTGPSVLPWEHAHSSRNPTPTGSLSPLSSLRVILQKRVKALVKLLAASWPVRQILVASPCSEVSCNVNCHAQEEQS